MSSLNTRAWISLVVLEVVLAVLLFACAGTTRYWQGWVYLLLLFVMAAGITVDLMQRDPALLARRMKGGPTAEPRPLQRFLMLGASIYTYHALTDETLIAELEFDRTGDRRYRAYLRTGNFCNELIFDVPGEQWPLVAGLQKHGFFVGQGMFPRHIKDRTHVIAL